jgi:hypothetical protein
MKGLVLILLITASCVEARIGDTEAQIETRYGPAVVKKDGYIERHTKRWYDFKNYQIEVEYVDGKSVVEYFRTKNHSPISAAETQIILTANAPWGEWVNQSAGAERVNFHWTCGSTLEAFRDDNTGFLFVEARWWPVWQEDARALAAKKDLSGF